MDAVEPLAELSTIAVGPQMVGGHQLKSAEGTGVRSNRPSGTPRVGNGQRSRIGIVLASPIVGLLVLFLLPLGGAVYYATTSPDEYTGRALVQFRPRATDNGGVVGNETTASSAASYGAFLGTPSTVRYVASQIGVRPAELRDNMTVQLLPATTSLSITFKDGSPDVSAQGASALAQVAVQRAADDPLVSAAVLAPASIPEAPSGPPRALIVAAGAVAGLLLATAAYFLAAALRRNGSRSEGARSISSPITHRGQQPDGTAHKPDRAAHTTDHTSGDPVPVR